HPARLCVASPLAILLPALRRVRGGATFWSAVAQLMALLLDLLSTRRQADGGNVLEIALLRHQLRVLQRRQPQARLARWEQLTLIVLLTKLRQLTANARQRWAGRVVLVTPETVLRWHRDLVRRKWACRRRQRAGRRPTDAALTALIVRLAREDPRWGYAR